MLGRKKITEVLNDVKSISDESDLYHYLVQLAKQDPDNPYYTPVFEQFLADKRSEIKKAAIFSLLFCYRLREARFIDFAVKIVLDDREEDDLRGISMASLGQALFGSKDKNVLKILYSIFGGAKNDYLRKQSFVSMLRIIGLSSRETLLKKIDDQVSENALMLYKAELSQIKKIIGV
jgi:hypothetical protein